MKPITKVKIKYAYDYYLNPSPVDNLVIETTNCCNYKCRMCWTTGDSCKRKRQHMSLEMFKKIIKKAYGLKIKKISFSYGGEPLLNKDLFKMIRYAKEKGYMTDMTTNASLLDDNKIQKLVESGIDSISISFHAKTSKTYKKIFLQDNFCKVISNITKLKSYIVLDSDKATKLSFNYYKMDLNKHEKSNQIHPLEGLVDSFVNTYVIDLPTCKEKHSLLKKCVNDRPCNLLQKNLIVFSDGTICLGCCFDFNGIFKIGHINKDTLEEAYYSKTSKFIRKAHLKGAYRKISLCKYCNINKNKEETERLI